MGFVARDDELVWKARGADCFGNGVDGGPSIAAIAVEADVVSG